MLIEIQVLLSINCFVSSVFTELTKQFILKLRIEIRKVDNLWIITYRMKIMCKVILKMEPLY